MEAVPPIAKTTRSASRTAPSPVAARHQRDTEPVVQSATQLNGAAKEWLSRRSPHLRSTTQPQRPPTTQHRPTPQVSVASYVFGSACSRSNNRVAGPIRIGSSRRHSHRPLSARRHSTAHDSVGRQHNSGRRRSRIRRRHGQRRSASADSTSPPASQPPTMTTQRPATTRRIRQWHDVTASADVTADSVVSQRRRSSKPRAAPPPFNTEWLPSGLWAKPEREPHRRFEGELHQPAAVNRWPHAREREHGQVAAQEVLHA